MGQNDNEIIEKWQKLSPKTTPAHTFAFAEVSKPEIGIRENHQLTTVKRNIHGSLDLSCDEVYI